MSNGEVFSVFLTLLGSNEEETARRLGISAETVARIVQQQLAEVKPMDPARVITSVGMDEISLKKRHKLYVTILTDLSQPEQPQVLAVEAGRDEAAGRKCLEKLSPEQLKRALFGRQCPNWAATAKVEMPRLLPRDLPPPVRCLILRRPNLVC